MTFPEANLVHWVLSFDIFPYAKYSLKKTLYHILSKNKVKNPNSFWKKKAKKNQKNSVLKIFCMKIKQSA